MDFSEKMKLIRCTYNLTQEEFAKNIGISRSNLVNIEKGRVKPTPVLINYLSLAYNIEKRWLQDDTVPMVDNIPINNKEIINDIIFYYNQLNEEYKEFVINQMKQLVELQSKIDTNITKR